MKTRSLPDATPLLLERFHSKVTRHDDGCWLWTGGKQSSGYGSFGFGRRGEVQTFLAHRLAFHWFVGPLADGLSVDHLCFVRTCVRPDHLQAVPREENSRRGRHRMGGRSAELAARLLDLDLRFRAS